jgi:hypothetical protein
VQLLTSLYFFLLAEQSIKFTSKNGAIKWHCQINPNKDQASYGQYLHTHLML